MEEQRAGFHHQEERTMTSPFVTKELEDALTTLKFKKTPVPDNNKSDAPTSSPPQQEESTAAVQ